MSPDKIIQNVKDKKLIAIVRGVEPEYIIPLAEALLAGGINMIEVTFDQAGKDHFASTVTAITKLSTEMGDRMYVGSGTVLSKEQVDLTVSAGGQYIITPSTNPEVIRYAKEKGLVAMPGAMTPTEAVTAYEAGADFVKIFPAGNLGPAYIKAIKAPLAHIPLLAVGGVNAKNIPDFLKAGAVGFGVGGNLVNKEWVRNNETERITALAAEFVAATKQS